MKKIYFLCFFLTSLHPIKSMDTELFARLFRAVQQNNPKLLQEKKRILAHITDEHGNTLLHKAVENNNVDMIRELVHLAPTLKTKRNKAQKIPREITSSSEIIKLLH